MKTTKKQDFEEAMRQRGYALEELSFCIVSQTDQEITFDEAHTGFPRAKKPPSPTHAPSRTGLGDMLAAGLSAVGITPERVSAVTGKPCGCKERQAKLNELGRTFGIG